MGLQVRDSAKMGTKNSTETDSQIQCEERERLQNLFVAAIREMVELQKQQTQAVLEHDDDFMRFDDLIHMARLAKDNAKYALLAHLATHRCHGAFRDTDES